MRDPVSFLACPRAVPGDATLPAFEQSPFAAIYIALLAAALCVLSLLILCLIGIIFDLLIQPFAMSFDHHHLHFEHALLTAQMDNTRAILTFRKQ